MSTLSSLNSLIPLQNQFQFPAISLSRIRSNHVKFSASLNNNSEETNLNLSVLRFTLVSPFKIGDYIVILGIPGFTPRWIIHIWFITTLKSLCWFQFIHVTFTAYILDIRSLFDLPYVGKFLKGAAPVERPALPEGNKQIMLCQRVSPIEIGRIWLGEHSSC
ncbi:hypothetical protein MKX01_003326 [Papaver californicum]|nr:hypothetical protein MKX01_003326 [Papaver californicum]